MSASSLAAPDDGLRRVLGPVRGLALSLGVVVGSGAFFLPAYLAQLLPREPWFVGVWVVGGLVALCVALCYAELATAFPQTGGYVVYLRRIYGDRVAFVYGWAAMLVLYPSSVATLARAFADARADLADSPSRTVWAVALILLAGALNVAGVALSARLQVGFTTLKVGALLALAIAGLAFAPGAEVPQPAPPPAFHPGLATIFLSLVAISWCFDGFLEIVTVAGEVRSPRRTLVRVLVGSVLVITTVYVLYAWAMIRHLPLPALAESTSAAADLARRLAGERGGTLVGVAVLLATGSVCVSLLFSGPRIVVGMADAGLFPRRAGAVWKVTGTPVLAVLVATGAALIYASWGSFVELVNFFQFSTGIFSALIVAGGWWLRVRGGIADEFRRIPWWPLPPLIALCASLGGAVFVLRQQPWSSVAGLLVMAAAVPLSRFLLPTDRSASSRG